MQQKYEVGRELEDLGPIHTTGAKRSSVLFQVACKCTCIHTGKNSRRETLLLRSARGNFPSYSKFYLREFHLDLKEKSSTQKIVRGGFILLFLPMSPCLLIRVENASSYGQSKTKEVAVCDIPQPIFEPIKFFWLHARFGNGWTVTIFFLSPSRTLAAPEYKHYFAWPSIVDNRHCDLILKFIAMQLAAE